MDNIVGKRIKEAMRIRNMKQSDIVKITGINKGALSSYINGNYLPKQNNLYKIATALKVSAVWLMGFNVPIDQIDDELKTSEKNNIIMDRNLGKFKEGEIVEIKNLFDFFVEVYTENKLLNKKMEKLMKNIEEGEKYEKGKK